MKIIQLIPTLSSGGAERIAVDLSNALLNRQNAVILVQLFKQNESNTFYKNQISSKINYINLNGNAPKIFEWKVLIRLILLIVKEKPNVIHSHLNIFYSLILVLFFPRRKLVHTLHNTADKECMIIKGYSLKGIIKFYYRRQLIIPITISEESKKSFEAFYGLSNSKLVFNGCNHILPSPEFRKTKEEILQLKSLKNVTIFINVARYSPQKNHQMLVNVFNKLINEGENIILLIIGHGFNSDSGEELMKNSLKDIYYLGTKENVTDYLLLSDAFCLSSLWEGLPISLLEAIGSGCTPICTPAGGIPNVIANKNLGIISKGFSEDDYYLAIKSFLLNRAKFNKQYLIEYFNNNFHIDDCASKIEEIYSLK